MADIYVYADETGDLDLTGAKGTSTYFGFGTATFRGDHGHALWSGMQLRCRLESRGVRLRQGLHAKDDSHATRSEAFELIAAQAPRLDATFLYKANATPSVKERGQLELYKVAWYLHFNAVITDVSKPGDTVFVVVGSLQTNNKQDAIRTGLEDVCGEHSVDRAVVPCIWDAPSSWGIQVADYGLWATQRVVEGRRCAWFEPLVRPLLSSLNAPWEWSPSRA